MTHTHAHTSKIQKRRTLKCGPQLRVLVPAVLHEIHHLAGNVLRDEVLRWAVSIADTHAHLVLVSGVWRGEEQVTGRPAGLLGPTMHYFKAHRDGQHRKQIVSLLVLSFYFYCRRSLCEGVTDVCSHPPKNNELNAICFAAQQKKSTFDRQTIT